MVYTELGELRIVQTQANGYAVAEIVTMKTPDGMQEELREFIIAHGMSRRNAVRFMERLKQSLSGS